MINYICGICNKTSYDPDWVDEYLYCESCNYVLYPLWSIEHQKYVNEYDIFTFNGAAFLGHGNLEHCMKILKMKVFA